MELLYKRAGIDDLEILTKTRIEVLRAANQLSDQIDIVSKIKSGNPSLAEKPGKDSFMKYVAGKRNMAMDLEGRQQYQVSLVCFPYI